MGVPHFYKWIRDKKYKGVLRRNVPRYVSSFSLDANGIIHEQAQLVYAYGQGENPARRRLVEKADPKMLEAELYNAISIKLQEILAQVRPTEIFVIAVDGVAPQGKISQQRQRRFRSAMDQAGKVVFDSNAITPGTDFMIRLDNFLQRWIVSYQSTLPPKVIYSSHMVPGEGEHKIMDLMRSGEISGMGSHVLYGMDADLIMLSMIAPLDNISLMREDIRDVIDINSFKQAIQQELKLPTAIQDFVVMMFTIGNDFLPHSPTLEDMDEAIATLMQVYKDTGRSLTTPDDKKSDIDWPGLSAFLTNLAKEETRLLQHEAVRDVKYPSRMLRAASVRTEKIEEGGAMIIGKKITFQTEFNYDIFRGAWYQNALTPRGQTFGVFKKIMPGYNFGVSMDKVVDMCEQYLIGMAWVYNYYTRGTAAINADFVYRYHHTPLLSDLSLVLSQIGSVDGYLTQGNQLVLNPIHQLLSVLPLKSKSLLPREVTHLMSKDSPIADLYPTEVIVEMDGKNAEWQGTVLIPFVEPTRVIQAVNSTTVFSEERARLYTQANNIVIIRDPEMVALDRQKKQFRQFMEKEKEKRFGRRGGRGRGRQGYRGTRDSSRNWSGARGRSRSHQTRDVGGYQGKGYQGHSNRRTYSRGRDSRPPQYGSPQARKEAQTTVWKRKTTIL